MVQCCRCNRTGICRGCACAKAGKSCIDCLPSKLGHCSNSAAKSQPSALPSRPLLPSRLISTTTSPTTQPASATSPTDEVSETGGVATSTTNCGNSSQAVSNSCPLCLADTLPLPPFTPMAEPKFTWGEGILRVFVRC